MKDLDIKKEKTKKQKSKRNDLKEISRMLGFSRVSSNRNKY